MYTSPNTEKAEQEVQGIFMFYVSESCEVRVHLLECLLNIFSLLALQKLRRSSDVEPKVII